MKNILRDVFAVCFVLLLGVPAVSQQPVPLPPQPAGSGPSLSATMQFIQDKLNDIGMVSFVVFLQDTSNGNTWTTNATNEISNVVADQNQCRISYHWRGTDLEALSPNEIAPRRKLRISSLNDDFAAEFLRVRAADRRPNGKAAYKDEDDAFSLRDVQEIVVKPFEQHGTERLAKNGSPNVVVTSTSPPITALVARLPRREENVFLFTDADLADRVAKAMLHAVELCGGGKAPEPF
jgi:hypothetical protein